MNTLLKNREGFMMSLKYTSMPDSSIDYTSLNSEADAQVQKESFDRQITIDSWLNSLYSSYTAVALITHSFNPTRELNDNPILPDSS